MTRVLLLSRRAFVSACAALTLLTASGLAEQPAATPPWKGPPDPILGRWRWFNKDFKTFHEDGTVTSEPRGLKGTWKFLKEHGEPRQYQINWGQSLWIDTLKLTKGGAELSGKNQEGTKITAYRVPSK